ncbi:MAG: hypothetical protein LBJ59_12010 [Zoogloeaceae bacterium]|jgi:hypothetical protein|nr:hypothetical protein [Zoogloeaceae bacterium]
MNVVKINWYVPPEERQLIDKIVARGMKAASNLKPEVFADVVEAATMDIICCHNHLCRLRLKAWLNADDFNFLHDFYGIYSHLDRNKIKLTGFFLPRFADRGQQ